MNDRQFHFIVAIGELCHAAKLGNYRVEVLMADGARIAGVPTPIADESDSQLDDTGLARTFRLDGALINFDQIRTLTIDSPDNTESRAH